MNSNQHRRIFFLLLGMLTILGLIVSCVYTPTISNVGNVSDESQNSSYESSSDSSSISESDSSSYISSDVSESTSSDISEISQITSQVECSSAKYIYVNEGIANFRKGPSSDYKIIRQLHYGTKLEFISIVGEWYKAVLAGETIGYVHSGLISDTIPDPQQDPFQIEIPDFAEWPMEYLIEDIYDADLAQYIGRYAGEGYMPLKGVLVIVDPGHGGEDPGYTYINQGTGRTLTEKYFNLEISLKLAEELGELGAEVILTRDDDEYVSQYKRCAIINKAVSDRLLKTDSIPDSEKLFLEIISAQMQIVIDSNSDEETAEARGIMYGIGASQIFRKFMDICAEADDVIYVSIHSNANFDDSSIKGTKIYYGNTDFIRNTEEEWLTNEPYSTVVNPSYEMFDLDARLKLAGIIRDKLENGTDLIPFKCICSEDTSNNSSEVMSEDGSEDVSEGTSDNDIYDGIFEGAACVIRKNNLTGILIEVGYLTNADDRGFMSEPAGQRRIAYAIAEGIYEYFCVEGQDTEESDE